MATTFRDQIDLFYEIVGDEDDSEIYPLATVKAQINAGESAFINAKTNWNFLRDKLLRTTLDTVLLGAAYTSPATSITLSDSTNWPAASGSSYAAMIEGDIIESWATNAANVLGTIPPLQVDHSDTSKKVIPLYVIPSTVAKIAGLKVDGIDYDFVDEDHFYQYYNKYTILEDQYIQLPELDDGLVVEIPYYKAPVTLVLDAAESLLPEEYRYAPVYYAAAKLLLATDEISKSGQYEGLYNIQLQEAMKRYASKVAESKKRIRVQKRLQSK